MEEDSKARDSSYSGSERAKRAEEGADAKSDKDESASNKSAPNLENPHEKHARAL